MSVSTRPRELNPCSSILFSLFRFISSFSINNLPCTHTHVLCKQLIAIYHKWFYFQKSTKSNFQFQDEKIANLSKIKLAPKETNSVTRFVNEKNVLFLISEKGSVFWSTGWFFLGQEWPIFFLGHSFDSSQLMIVLEMHLQLIQANMLFSSSSFSRFFSAKNLFLIFSWISIFCLWKI